MGVYVTADRIEELPEGFRAKAAEQNGKWVAEVAEGFEIANVQDLKQQVVQLRHEKKVISDKLSEFGWRLRTPAQGGGWEPGGIDSNKARGMAGSENASAEKLREAIEQKYGDDMRRLQDQATKLQSQLKHALINERAATALANAGGNVELLMPVVTQRADLEIDEDSGRARVTLRDEAGRPLLAGRSGSTDPMDIEEFVDTLRRSPKFRAAFAGSGVGGAGTSSQSGLQPGRSVHRGFDASELSSTELIQRGNERQASLGG